MTFETVAQTSCTRRCCLGFPFVGDDRGVIGPRFCRFVQDLARAASGVILQDSGVAISSAAWLCRSPVQMIRMADWLDG